MGLFNKSQYRIKRQALGEMVSRTRSIEIPASEYRCILQSGSTCLVIEEECSGVNYILPMTKIGRAVERGDCFYLDFDLFTAVQANRVFKPGPMAAPKAAPRNTVFSRGVR